MDVIKKADISLFGIDDEKKNDSSSIYTTKIKSSKYPPLTYKSTTPTISHGYEIFTYTGTIQTFKVPSGTESVNVYCWGAGGGSSRAELNTTPIRGGNGGFVKATLTIPSGTTSLGIIVGQGGSKGSIAGTETTRTAFGGGGSGVNNYIGWGLGGGGGLSGVFVNDANFTIVSGYYVNTSATAIIIAGGGGGAGGYSIESGDTHGGSGGSTSANDGSGNRPGGGGSQLAGGSAGTANGYAQGTAGSKYLGGNGATGSFNPGGGGGYYGGGAGGVEPGKVSGAGGGSSFVNTGSYTITNITNLKTQTNGTPVAVGNTETYYQQGIALGGLTATSSTVTNDGLNGLVVIEYLTNADVNTNALVSGIFNYDTTYNLHYLNNSNYSIKFTDGKIEVGTLPIKPSTDYIELYKKPLVWYKFDDTTDLGLDSMNLHNLTNPNGVVSSTDFKKGTRSASFDGTNDYLTKTSAFNLNSKSWSISLWFKKTTNSRADWLFEIGTTLSGGQILTCGYLANNKIRFSNFLANLDTTDTYSDAGTWIHLCFTFLTGTKTAIIYRNGVNVAQMNFTIEYTTNDVFSIGKFSTNYALGLIDDFRIYEYTLTPEEVNTLYNNRYIDKSFPLLKDNTGVTINPHIWYKLDNSFTDSGTAANNLTNSGATFDTTDYIKGSGSISFNGTSFCSFTNSVNLYTIQTTTGISFSFWFRATPSSATYSTLLEFSNGAGYRMFIRRAGNAEMLTFAIWQGDYLENFTSGTDFFNNTWYHIVWCISTTGVWTVYANGVNTGITVTRSFINGINYNAAYKTIGTGANGALTGNMDDFRIYQKVLTPAEVNELYRGRVEILTTATNKTFYNQTNPYLLLNNTIDGVTYLLTTKPSTFEKKNTKRYLFNIDRNIKQLKLTDKAKLAIKSITIPTVISKSYLQSKAVNNVIIKMIPIPMDRYMSDSSQSSGNPILFSIPLKTNNQGFGVNYNADTLPDLVTTTLKSRLNTDNNGYLFINPNPDYLYNFSINQSFLDNGYFEFEVIYDIGEVFQLTSTLNTYNFIPETLDYNTDRDNLEGFNINFIITDVDDSGEKVYNEMSLLNKINRTEILNP